MFVISTTFLIYTTGLSAVIGLAIYCVMVGLVVILAIKTGRLRSKTGEEADHRLSVLEELLSAMQIVKMLPGDFYSFTFNKKLIQLNENNCK